MRCLFPPVRIDLFFMDSAHKELRCGATGIAGRRSGQVSNVFDGDKDLGGMKLSGVPRRSGLGFLTLFEHYGSVQVRSRALLLPVSPWRRP